MHNSHGLNSRPIRATVVTLILGAKLTSVTSVFFLQRIWLSGVVHDVRMSAAKISLHYTYKQHNDEAKW